VASFRLSFAAVVPIRVATETKAQRICGLQGEGSIKAILTVGVAPVDLTCRSHAHFKSFAAVPTGTGVAAAVWRAGFGAAVGRKCTTAHTAVPG